MDRETTPAESAGRSTESAGGTTGAGGETTETGGRSTDVDGGSVAATDSPTVVLYGGKGGVGKTTCAAAHALALADRGVETLVVSTDPAHSLGDALERDIGGEPTVVAEGLSAVEVDPERGQEAYRAFVEALVEEFRAAGLRVGEAELERLFEVGLVPGGDEIAALEYVARYADDEYDTVVFDTAPTGHTLRLLDLPAVLGETLGVAGQVRERVRRTTRAARSAVLGPAAFWGGREDDDDVEALRDRIEAVGDLLRDPDRTQFRVVLTPERMAIAEADRLLDRLASASVPVDSLVLNRVFDNDEGCACERCRRDAARHADRRGAVEERFEHPVTVVSALDGEAQGLDALRTVGPSLVG
jgi:arsenite-transporting ATPase